MDASDLLNMVRGFISKINCENDCNSSKANFVSVGKSVHLFVKEEVGHFFDLINRECLVYSSNLLFNVAQYAYLVFNVCIYSVECIYFLSSTPETNNFGSYE